MAEGEYGTLERGIRKLDAPQQTEPNLIVEIRWWREIGWGVSRITIRDPKFKTENGLGIGATFGDIVQHHPVSKVSAGESPYLFAIVRELGMSFILDISHSDMSPQWRRTKDQSLIPKDANITSILVTGRPTKQQPKDR